MNSTPSLFDIIEEESISLKDAAEALSVSVATIRNWIKEGYLNLSKSEREGPTPKAWEG